MDEFLSEQALMETVVLMAAELAEVLEDDANASDLVDAHEQVLLQGFGSLPPANASGVVYDPQLLPFVATTSGLTSTIDSLSLWDVPNEALDPPLPQSIPAGAARTWVYTAVIGGGPEAIGVAISLDLDALGIQSCAGAAFCEFTVLVPITLHDPNGLLSAQQIGEFLAGLLDGTFSDGDALLEWLELQAVQITPLVIAPGTTPVAGGADCAVDDLMHCIFQAADVFGYALNDIRQDLADTAAPLVADLLDVSQDVAAGVWGSAMKGSILGVHTPNVNPIQHAASQAALLSASELATMQGGAGAAAAQDLEDAIESAALALCSNIDDWLDDIESCFDAFCPNAPNQDEYANMPVFTDWKTKLGCP